MNPERFNHLLAAYGGDLRRWPAVERDPARRLLSAQPRLRRDLDDAAALDAALDAWRAISPTDALRRRVLAAAPKARAAFSFLIDWPSRAGLAGACAAGILAGVLLGPPPAGEDPATLSALAPYDPVEAIG